jgi:hypothetical protein
MAAALSKNLFITQPRRNCSPALSLKAAAINGRASEPRGQGISSLFGKIYREF